MKTFLEPLQELEEMRRAADRVHIGEAVGAYIVSLVSTTRRHPLIVQGASPRATLAVADMSRAAAFVQGRDYVIPEDVSAVFRPVIGHRILLRVPAGGVQQSRGDLLGEILGRVKAPRLRP